MTNQLKYLLCLPAGILGSLFGIFAFALAPGIVFNLIWYGQPIPPYGTFDPVQFMNRPAAVAGFLIGVVVAACGLTHIRSQK